MVKNIVAAFGKRIDNLDWMTPATQARKRRRNSSTLYVGIGYPEHWRDYAGLKIEPRRRARQRRARRALRLPRQPGQARQAGRQDASGG